MCASRGITRPVEHVTAATYFRMKLRSRCMRKAGLFIFLRHFTITTTETNALSLLFINESRTLLSHKLLIIFNNYETFIKGFIKRWYFIVDFVKILEINGNIIRIKQTELLLKYVLEIIYRALYYFSFSFYNIYNTYILYGIIFIRAIYLLLHSNTIWKWTYISYNYISYKTNVLYYKIKIPIDAKIDVTCNNFIFTAHSDHCSRCKYVQITIIPIAKKINNTL